MKRLNVLGALISFLVMSCAQITHIAAPIAETFQSEYSAKPITLRVVDEETGAPIEGVIATANWELVTGTPMEYARDLDRLSDALFGVGYRHGSPCNWKSFPKMLSALNRQESEFRRAGVAQGTVVSQLKAVDSKLTTAGCGSINDLLMNQ